jgi:hypothetical protein
MVENKLESSDLQIQDNDLYHQTLQTQRPPCRQKEPKFAQDLNDLSKHVSKNFIKKDAFSS